MTDQSVAGDTVVITERIAAPRETVFRFLVEPEKILRWMGKEIDVDPQPGGKFWMNATGTDIAIGTFVEVTAPERVVFTWGWEGSAEVPPGSSTVTITLTSDGDHTVVELAHAGLPGGAGDDHSNGWGYFVPRLAAVAAGIEPGVNTHLS